MMIVAIVLGLGFAVLVLLALYLCVVISFVQPFVWPPWWFRFQVILTALALIALTAQSVDGSLSIGSGLDVATEAISNLSVLMVAAAQREPNVTLAASAFNASIMSTAACLGCLSYNGSTPLVPTNTTLGDVCADLAVAPLLLHDAAELGRTTAAAAPQADHLVYIVHSSSGWQVWASMLPLYALTATGTAVVVGAIGGRRNLLLLAQFVAVIVWWMMCAVISVEIAIAVGFADSCGDAVNTTLRVLRTEAQHGQDELPKPTDLWHYNLSAHYLAEGGCSVPNPLTSALRGHAETAHAAYAELVTGTLPAKMPWVSKCADPDEAGAAAALDAALEALLDPLGGAGACGGAGPVRELFARGAEHGLCGLVGEGFVQLWYWQLIGGAVLVLLSLLLPVLWHSHHLPPATLPSWREVRRAARPAACLRSVRAAARAVWAVGVRCCGLLWAALSRPAHWLASYRYSHSQCDPDGPADADEALAQAAEPSSVRAPMLLPWRGAAPAPADASAGAGAAIVVPLASSRIGSRCPSPTLTPLSGPSPGADQGTEPLLLAPRERMGTTCSSHEVL